MQSFGVLDLVIGLVFVYLLLSFVCLAVNEGIATVLHLRAHTLHNGIRALLQGPTRSWEDDALSTAFYSNPLIASLRERRLFPWAAPKLPSYIPSRTFTLALMQVVRDRAPAGSPARSVTVINDAGMLRDAVTGGTLPEDLRAQLVVMIDEGKGNLDAVKQAIDRWFENGMERLSAVYKQRIQVVSVIVALVVAFAADANTITMARTLSADTSVREAVAAAAIQFAQKPPAVLQTAATNDTATRARFDSVAGAVKSLLETTKQAGLPLGYDPDSLRVRKAGYVVDQIESGIVGLLITAFAISLGAPFWFDILNKIVNIRSAGRAPEEKPKSPEALPPARG